MVNSSATLVKYQKCLTPTIFVFHVLYLDECHPLHRCWECRGAVPAWGGCCHHMSGGVSSTTCCEAQ